jgi:hypothetical protein
MALRSNQINYVPGYRKVAALKSPDKKRVRD